jgi:GMP synthase-like glutamine amidotransferase
MGGPGPVGRAVFVIHDADPVRGPAEVGTLTSHAARAGLAVSLALPTELPELAPLADDGADPDAIALAVVMGSAESAYDDRVPWLAGELRWIERALEVGVPVLGVCFGGQALARVLGGTVARAARSERGFLTLTSSDHDLVPPGPWMAFHYDAFTVPPGGELIASTPDAAHAFTHGPHMGLQFHPEISPGVFEAWWDSWKASDLLEAVKASGVDLDGLKLEVRRRAAESTAMGGRLFDAFWARASQYRYAVT